MPNSKQRRDAERRRLQRQLQRRQQRQAARKRLTLIASVVGTLVVIAVVVGFIVATTGDDKSPAAAAKSPTASPTAPSTTTVAKPGQCTFKPSGQAARKVKVPAATAPTKGTGDVVMKTSQGTMTFALDRAAAPCAAENFASLAQQKYFDGTPCHRLTSGGLNVLQCGDPTGTGRGGPGYSFNDELTGKEQYTRGVLAMANSGPNTNGSQFFIVYKDSRLGPQYTIFGRVKSGLGVVDKVAAKGATTGTDGKPKLAISIQTATVAR